MKRNKNTSKRDVQATFAFNIVKNVSKREIKTITVYAKNNATKKYAEVASIFRPLKLHRKLHQSNINFVSINITL